MLRDRDATRVIPVACVTVSGRNRLVLRLFVGSFHRLVCRLKDEAVEHELIGVDLFRPAAVDATKKLLHLMLKDLELVMGRGELFGQLGNLLIFLLNKLGLCK